jgi:hypothetical protein
VLALLPLVERKDADDDHAASTDQTHLQLTDRHRYSLVSCVKLRPSRPDAALLRYPLPPPATHLAPAS